MNHLTSSRVDLLLTDIKAKHKKRVRVSLVWLKGAERGPRERTMPSAHGKAHLKSLLDSQRDKREGVQSMEPVR